MTLLLFLNYLIKKKVIFLNKYSFFFYFPIAIKYFIPARKIGCKFFAIFKEIELTNSMSYRTV
jgi:hypothetical protein